MKIRKHTSDQMTPIERKKAIAAGEDIDRIPCIPFMDGAKSILSGISIWDYWHDPMKMAETEIIVFNRFGYDRIVIGPNTRGITEALGGQFIYPKKGVPYLSTPFLTDYRLLDKMDPIRAGTHPRIRDFLQAAGYLCGQAAQIVPIEMSIGGPFTIASNLRGVEILMRDCRRHPQAIHRLMRVITDSQKSCIDEAAKYSLGIAMADPVANPMLIGPRLYEEFVYPYTKELTDYVHVQTGHRVSLHMCGKTYKIWEYLRQYPLNELSLDNVVDLTRAVKELGDILPLAGNVDPVAVILHGTKEEITAAVHTCIRIGLGSKKGFTLATGCDIPDATRPEQIDHFMTATRDYKY